MAVGDGMGMGAAIVMVGKSVGVLKNPVAVMACLCAAGHGIIDHHPSPGGHYK